MKNSKREPSSNAQRKSAGKKSANKAGSAKLDRKSSRGMIYENEELRLRTININAEVERGQSDIRKLRRENEQLRREIWSLRDEYDRLNKRFKANKYLPDSISEHGQSESNSEDSDSCDTCRGDSNDECLADRKQHQHRDSLRQRDSCSPSSSAAEVTIADTAATAAAVTTYDRCTGSVQEPTPTETFETNDCSATASKTRDNLHVLFDHLSIVSEENLSNSDGNLTQAGEAQQFPYNCYYEANPLELDASNLSLSHCLGAMSLPSLLGPSTPITPIELVANQLNDLQSIIPPLSYFENIVKQHSTIDSTASTNTGETVIQTNGWDYNIQSPFSARQFQPSEVSSSNSTSTTMSPSHVNYPRESTPQPDISTNPNSSCTDGSSNHKPHKHFFSPIKPRLKLDTALAARAAILAPPPTGHYPDLTHPKYDPPDVYITNALASPYYPKSIAGLSLPSVIVPPMQHAPPYIEPIYATAQKKPHPPDQSQLGGESSKSSVNLEQILNEIGTITEDILQLQLEKSRSQERLLVDSQNLAANSTTGGATLHTTTTHTQTVSPNNSPTSLVKEQQCQSQSMPSDKNLPVAKIAMTAGECSSKQTTTTSDAVGELDSAVDTVGASDRQGNSPSPPQLPTPMAPFPTNLMYLAFDRVNPSLIESGDPRFGLQKVGLGYAPPVASSSLDSGNHQRVVSPVPGPPPPPPPLPPPSLSYACSDQGDDHVGFRIRKHEALHPALALSSPDLSNSPLATMAPLKRRLFSKQHDDNGNSRQITRSFDGDDAPRGGSKPPESDNLSEVAKLKTALEESVNEISSYESSSGSEATKRKSSRRVSIVCRDEKADTVPSEAVDQQHQSSVSVDRLDEMMPSLLGNQKHAHSTPNSPHSNRRRGNTNSAISVTSGSSTLHHHGHHHHHHHHHHSRKLSQESINEPAGTRGTSVANSIVNSGPDNVGPTTSSSQQQNPTRYKCSRRHSDGTVASVVATAGGTGLRLSGTSSHHHHHHHVDSTHETATSLSERNSGSLASSRDSSTSLSMRSQRRKISVSSHTGGKIPWCGCWGNGCL